MSDQYIGEIRMFTGGAGVKVPKGWAFCDGAILPIQGNEALFTLLGTTYGGDGRTNFALPDLRGRLPIHNGTLTPGGPTYNRGNAGGSETVKVAVSELPTHTHTVRVVSGPGSATTPTPTATTFLATSTVNMYAATSASTTAVTSMSSQSVSFTGGSDAHNNVMPYLTIVFIIALQGIFPTSS